MERTRTAGPAARLMACWLALVSAAAAAPQAAPNAPPLPAGDVLTSLRPGHPRLLLTGDQWQAVKDLVQKDPLARKWHDVLKTQAEKSLSAAPIEHVLVGPRLLDKSRTALNRVTLWAAMYRLDGDARFAERARKEMLVAAGFADWNPSHFLDTAEMTNALALGYDWLYDAIPADERATLRRAIVEKGLKQAVPIYQEHRWWATARHNWNQVCNGGIAVGALALADEEPELAGKIVAWSRESIPLAMGAFAPDGGCPEGPGYWDYATIYNAYYLAAMESALGTDWGLKDSPGFARTGLFHIHSVGPIGKAFNYADAGEGGGPAAQMMWFARAYHQPLYAAHERWLAADKPRLFDLLWYDAEGQPPAEAKTPTDALFRGVNVAFFRTAWADKDAVYLGFKGGDNKANHAHLDLGTFVLDAFGQRWALDLGGDDYNLPGYFGNKRWTYYRLRTEGHNTLTVDGENQDADGKAPLVAYLSSPGRSFAVADLRGAYKKKLSAWRRGVALLDGRRVLVQDEVSAASPVEVVWNFHTRAKAEIIAGGGEAVLALEGVKLRAKILSPTGATFAVVSANPPPPQKQQPDVSNLTLALPGKTTSARIVVLLANEGDSSAAPEVEELEKWLAAGKIEK